MTTLTQSFATASGFLGTRDSSSDGLFHGWPAPRSDLGATDLWRSYRCLDESQQRLFRALIFDGDAFAGSATFSVDHIVPAARHSVDRLLDTIDLRLDNFLEMSFGTHRALLTTNWDLGQSALPAFVPEHWISEVNGWSSESAEVYPIDWDQ